MTNEKLNLFKSHPEYYKAKQSPSIREFEPYYYITISGQSGPEEELFTSAIQTIYPVAFGIKSLCKANNLDFVVPKLEGQWWVEDVRPFDEVPTNEWFWRIMIRMPDFVNEDLFDQAKSNMMLKGKKGRFNELKFEQINEGKCVQLLHIGPYTEEGKSIDKIIDKLKTESLEFNGHHHEIYISDPQRTPAWKLKTILRYPVK